MSKTRNKATLTILIMLIIVSCIGYYVGHFLFFKKPESKLSKASQNPVAHKHISTQINGNKQEMDILEVDLKDGRVKVMPALSFNSIFGFDKLSSIAASNNAYAAVNAGFFYEYGQPSGMVVVDGEIFTNSTGRYPVLVINAGKAELKQFVTSIWINSGGKKAGIDGVNIQGTPDQSVLFTRAYGTDNRVKSKSITATIENGEVKKVAEYNGKVDIPENGMLLTCFEPKSVDLNSFPLKAGDKAVLHCEPDLGKDTQAYECGSWIVKGGKVVIGDRDEWIGVLTNHDPRTAVGIKEDGKLVLLTVDGRQPDYSTGLTARELGEFLINYGVKDAAMLDGGASTEMIVEGEIINKPSYKGQERPLGGAIIVKLTVDN